MPAPWAGGAQARIIGRIHGQTTVNVMHFATNDSVEDGGILDDILLALVNAIGECVIDTLLPAVSVDWTFIQADARRIFPAPSDPIIFTAPGGSVGELGVTSVSFAASLLSIRTGGGGRRGRGRVFLPPAGEAQIANSAIDGPTMVLLAAFAACVASKFMGADPATPWHLGILSRKNLSGIGGTFNNSFRQATQLSAVQNVAVMGSRKIGHGV